MTAMNPDEYRAFLQEGTRTLKLATTRDDGRPHVAPVWFLLDGDMIVFTTGAETVKGKALRRDGHVALCVDDERPPFAFVLIEGTAMISTDAAGLRRWATRIAARYMGADQAEAFGARNGAAGELLVRVASTHVVAQRDVAD